MTVVLSEAHLPWRKLSVSEIKRCVCLFYKINEAELCSQNRKHKFSHPRQVAMMLCREFLGISWPRIALYFGGRDHTTAMNAPKAINRRCKTNPKYMEDIACLRSALVMRVQENLRLAALALAEENARQAAVNPVDSRQENPDIIPNGVETCSPL